MKKGTATKAEKPVAPKEYGSTLRPHWPSIKGWREEGRTWAYIAARLAEAGVHTQPSNLHVFAARRAKAEAKAAAEARTAAETQEEEVMLTPAQVRKKLQISQWQLRNLVNEGKLKRALGEGKGARFRPEDVKALTAGQSAPGAPWEP